RHRKAASGVGNQNIDRPKRLFDLTTHRLDLIEFGDVSHHLQRCAAALLNASLNRRQRSSISAVYRDLGALLGETTRNCSADSTRTARHQSHFVCQTTHRLYPPVNAEG